MRLVLGDTGKNFAAGATGGLAHVLDGDGDSSARSTAATAPASIYQMNWKKKDREDLPLDRPPCRG